MSEKTIQAQMKVCDACAEKIKAKAKVTKGNKALAIAVYFALCMTCKSQEPQVVLNLD